MVHRIFEGMQNSTTLFQPAEIDVSRVLSSDIYTSEDISTIAKAQDSWQRDMEAIEEHSAQSVIQRERKIRAKMAAEPERMDELARELADIRKVSHSKKLAWKRVAERNHRERAAAFVPILSKILLAVEGVIATDQKTVDKRAARFGVTATPDAIQNGLLQLKGRIENATTKLESALARDEATLGEWPAPLTIFRGLMPSDLSSEFLPTSRDGE